MTSNRGLRLWGLFPDQKNRIGRMLGYGSCYRCGDTCNWKPMHTTTYSQSSGCFPLCEECWSALTPGERLPFYAQLMHAWTEVVPERPEWALESLRKWPAIEEAVLNGL